MTPLGSNKTFEQLEFDEFLSDPQDYQQSEQNLNTQQESDIHNQIPQELLTSVLKSSTNIHTTNNEDALNKTIGNTKVN